MPFSSSPPPLAVAMVYRARNAAWAAAFLDRLPRGADLRLWALDRAVPALADLTVGEGPGNRFPPARTRDAAAAAPGPEAARALG